MSNTVEAGHGGNGGAAPQKRVETLETVAIRFVGDSGDGMQLASNVDGRGEIRGFESVEGREQVIPALFPAR